MRKKSYKGKCIKRTIEKSSDVCRTYEKRLEYILYMNFLKFCENTRLSY